MRSPSGTDIAYAATSVPVGVSEDAPEFGPFEVLLLVVVVEPGPRPVQVICPITYGSLYPRVTTSMRCAERAVFISDFGVSATALPRRSNAQAGEPPIRLRARYVMSGTDLERYQDVVFVPNCTDTTLCLQVGAASSLRACYAMSGTDVTNADMSCLCMVPERDRTVPMQVRPPCIHYAPTALLPPYATPLLPHFAAYADTADRIASTVHRIATSAGTAYRTERSVGTGHRLGLTNCKTRSWSRTSYRKAH
eukprot:3940711-Rhodomonas_salina.3